MDKAAKRPATLNQIRVSPNPANVEVLRGICAGELLGAFGLGEVERGRSFLDAAARLTARPLARKVAVYDEVVGESGLKAGGEWAMERVARDIEVRGVYGVPTEGPLLIASNHPGISDTLALFAAIPRDDLRVVAAKRPFLEALPNTSRRLLAVGETSAGRFGLIREATRHMKNRRAILTFPGGEIEPDPAVLPGASEALESWSESLDLFARLVPNLAVVPVVVSGVLSAGALGNPLTFARRREEDRRWLAATLQMLAPRLHQTTVKVEFGKVVRTGEKSEVSGAVLEEARRLIEAV